MRRTLTIITIVVVGLIAMNCVGATYQDSILGLLQCECLGMESVRERVGS